MKNILITGAAGFIGSNFVKHMIDTYGETYNYIIYDKLTYVANMDNLKPCENKYTFVKGDICNLEQNLDTLKKFNIDAVVNFAAESHVDNSIKRPLTFTENNVLGTHSLIEACKQFWGEGSSNRFVHISTDEVYGSLKDNDPAFVETLPLAPNSPYSASKAGSDLIVRAYTETFNMNIIRVNAQQRFLNKLAGVTEPEEKRKIIGSEFIRVFEEEAKKIGKVHCLVQGTIYPDVIESGAGDASVIKSHHNVGGLPDVIDFDEIVEPLRDLFKDEVRAAGEQLGIPHDLVWRQPFPGPGLAVRIIGEITAEKLKVLQDADAIFREEIAAAGLERDISQYFAVLTGNRSVGVMGDARTYGYTVALRAVNTDDFMTVDWTRLPYDVLEKASSRITNEVRSINRVVYDITSKPPATVEWE